MSNIKVTKITETGQGVFALEPSTILVDVLCVGAGGGGGSGSTCQDSKSQFGNGMVGLSGQSNRQTLPIEDLEAVDGKVHYFVGKGGSGGEIQDSKALDGVNGSDGGGSYFSNIGSAGGQGGTGGSVEDIFYVDSNQTLSAFGAGGLPGKSSAAAPSTAGSDGKNGVIYVIEYLED